jgi:hypothetical protein
MSFTVLSTNQSRLCKATQVRSRPTTNVVVTFSDKLYIVDEHYINDRWLLNQESLSSTMCIRNHIQVLSKQKALMLPYTCRVSHAGMANHREYVDFARIGTLRVGGPVGGIL